MGGYEDRQIVAYRNVPELMGLIEPWSLRKEKEDCLDLPPKTYETRSIEMAPAQKKAYKELKKTLETTIETEAGEKNHIEVDTVLEAYLRLQQITGGFYPKEKTHDDGKPTVQLPIPGANPKLIELLEILDDFKGRKVIIWARFRAEIAAIVKAIKDRNVVQFHGGLNMEQKTESVSSFQEGDADVFVATPASGAYGLTLTAAHTAIYYSMSFSLEEYLQSQDRIHRIGQTIACSYIMLGCSGTVDMNVMSALMEKKSLADFVNDRLKHGSDIGDIF